MVTIVSSGSLALTVGTTPDSVYATTTAGTYQATFDLSPLVDDEEVVISVQRKVLTGGTIREAYSERLRGTLAQPIVITYPVSSGFGVTFTLNQRNGTTRTIDWEVLSI